MDLDMAAMSKDGSGNILFPCIDMAYVYIPSIWERNCNGNIQLVSALR